MKRLSSFGWFSLLLNGLSIGCISAVQASEVVSYTPGNPFNFNPHVGNVNENFGSINVQSDSSTGWILKIRSENQSSLKHIGSTHRIQYTLTVDGVGVELSNGTDAIAKSVTVMTCPPPTGCNLSLLGSIGTIEIDGKPAGRYSDTLVFTLTNQ